MKELLTIEKLNVDLQINNDLFPAVEEVTLSVREKESVGIVGESGSGKSLTAKAILQILPKSAVVTAQQLQYKEADLQTLTDKQMRNLRGKEISMIFQDSSSSLNPVMKVGKQVEDVLRVHERLGKEARKKKVLEMFQKVGFDDPNQVYASYPHQLSGGMRQRIVISMALIADPNLIVADEPTTALDNTIQKQILDIMKEMIRKHDKSLVLISHDWGVISQMCDRVYVMYAGRIVEEGKVQDVISRPQHPYTQGLLSAIPSLTKKGEKLFSIPFKVAAIDERQKGKWPYIEALSRYRQSEIETMFPKRGEEDL
ncbi:ABC transporter ATP-binding protein [Facklamia lactis]|uniref:ABC transporter ATP-binding protein n=1 Tax=Facklamia lactis TaxID=2749967 RepID=UPI0018CD8082|nr:ABC transporter ATP-binding protein [Facklamia lactis]MBG9981047.1 ABC transporter ATP-binding protein [Facklamia lactis]